MGGISYGCFAGMNYLWERPRLSMMITIPIAIFIYFIMVMATGTITERDLDEIPGGNKLKQVRCFIERVVEVIR